MPVRGEGGNAGAPVIIADARQAENLVKAGVKRADSIIPCTSNELANPEELHKLNELKRPWLGRM